MRSCGSLLSLLYVTPGGSTGVITVGSGADGAKRAGIGDKSDGAAGKTTSLGSVLLMTVVSAVTAGMRSAP